MPVRPRNQSHGGGKVRALPLPHGLWHRPTGAGHGGLVSHPRNLPSTFMCFCSRELWVPESFRQTDPSALCPTRASIRPSQVRRWGGGRAGLPRVTGLRRGVRTGRPLGLSRTAGTPRRATAPSAIGLSVGLPSWPTAELPPCPRPTAPPPSWGRLPRGFRSSSSDSESPSSATAIGTAFRRWEGRGESCEEDSA